jgi:hypothetical protein
MLPFTPPARVNLSRGGGSRTRRCAAYETAEPPLLHPRKSIGCGGGTRTRTDSFTRRALSYPFKLRRKRSCQLLAVSC